MENNRQKQRDKYRWSGDFQKSCGLIQERDICFAWLRTPVFCRDRVTKAPMSVKPKRQRGGRKAELLTESTKWFCMPWDAVSCSGGLGRTAEETARAPGPVLYPLFTKVLTSAGLLVQDGPTVPESRPTLAQLPSLWWQ